MFAYGLNNPVNCSDPTGEITITSLILIGSAVIGAASAGHTAYKTYQAGWGTGDILWYSVGAGLSGFLTVYSLGMSAYQMYTQYCYLNGITPVTDVSLSSSSTSTQSVPQAAYDTKNYVNSHNGSPPEGYKGGKQFLNDGRNGGQVLPADGSPYYEYDIYPHVPNVSRGAERIVIGSDGSAWYTNDHYKSFIFLEE